MSYTSEHNYSHDRQAKLGILITNLGTPDAPTAAALKPYLAEFLWDPRIVEPPPPRAVWWMILHGIILNLRPKAKAHDYQTIWGKFGEGSPLLDITNAQAAGIHQRLSEAFPNSPIEVAVAMRYGNPSMTAGLDALRQKGCERLLVLPLYPQYASYYPFIHNMLPQPLARHGMPSLMHSKGGDAYLMCALSAITTSTLVTLVHWLTVCANTGMHTVSPINY